MKKITITLVLAVVCAGISSLTFATSALPTASEVASRWVKNGIIGLDSNLSDVLKRGDATSMYVAIVKHYRGRPAVEDLLSKSTKDCTFWDVTTTNVNGKWINESCQLWVFKWVEGNFLDQNNLTPSQALVTLMRVLGGKQDETVTPRWKNYLDLAIKHNIVPTSDLDLINNGQTITKSKILEWIYTATNSATLKTDPLVQSANVAMFGKDDSVVSSWAVVEAKINDTNNTVNNDTNKEIIWDNWWKEWDDKWDKKWAIIDKENADYNNAMINKDMMRKEWKRWKRWWWMSIWCILAWIVGLRLLWKLLRWLFCSCKGNNTCCSGCNNKDNQCGCDTNTCVKEESGMNIWWSEKGIEKHNASYINTTLDKENSWKKVNDVHESWSVSATHHHDDLKIIEGIGPKVEQLLFENSITTFAQLADMSSEEISNILSSYGWTYAAMSTDTWPTQALLARDGKIEELETLKRLLDNGTMPS